MRISNHKPKKTYIFLVIKIISLLNYITKKLNKFLYKKTWHSTSQNIKMKAKKERKREVRFNSIGVFPLFFWYGLVRSLVQILLKWFELDQKHFKNYIFFLYCFSRFARNLLWQTIHIPTKQQNLKLSLTF